jgi:D-alanyl-lipoteichoic acid acyltransferase DltB (MBOAT superfamily)
MTLGQWFRDYVFTPLHLKLMRTNLPPMLATAVATFVTFLLIGAWHGINGKYFLWAAFNAYFVLYMPFRDLKWLRRPVTLSLILVSNLLFLSRDLGVFANTLGALLTKESWILTPEDFDAIKIGLVLLTVFSGAELLLQSLQARTKQISARQIFVSFVVCWVMLFFGVIIGIGRVDSIYSGF